MYLSVRCPTKQTSERPKHTKSAINWSISKTRSHLDMAKCKVLLNKETSMDHTMKMIFKFIHKYGNLTL